MKKQPLSYEDHGGKKRKGNQEYEPKDKYPRMDNNSDSSPRKATPGQKLGEYTRVNALRSQILLDIEKDTDVRWPKPLRTDPEKRDKSLFCRFHKDIGHDIDDCRQLKDEIEFLIRRGCLNRYTKDGGRDDEDRRSDQRDQDDRRRNTQPRGPVINMIFGGPTAAGTSSNSRKAYAREVMHIVGEAPKREKVEIVIVLEDSDLEGIKFPHDDPLVISPIIGNSEVK